MRLTTYNGLQDPKNITSLSGCPNILTIKSPSLGKKASATITVAQPSTNDGKITINGISIMGVQSYSSVTSTTFWSDTRCDDLLTMAHTIKRALSNTSVGVNYIVNIKYNNGLQPIIYIEARENGSQYNISIDNNMGLTTSTITGQSTGDLDNSDIYVDIYKVSPSDEQKMGGTDTDKLGDFLITLHKRFHQDMVSFDLTPVLSTMTREKGTIQYSMVCYSIRGNKTSQIAVFTRLYATDGYMVNDGYPFIPKVNGTLIAQNVSKGTPKETINNTTLYVGLPSIPLSLYMDSSITNLSVTVKYLDSARNTKKTVTQTLSRYGNLNDFTINLENDTMRLSHYIDIIFPDKSTIRYNVIKPMGTSPEIHRVLWRNSYGGLSFFDFAGEYTEERKTNVTYYQKSDYDYYESSVPQTDKVYTKDVTVSYDLTSHNITTDGQWSIFDLQKSRSAWLERDNVKYPVTITDIKVSEIQNGIYKAQVTLADNATT